MALSSCPWNFDQVFRESVGSIKTAIPAQDLFPRTTRLRFSLYDGLAGQLYSPLHVERIRAMSLIAIRASWGKAVEGRQ